MSTVEIAGSGLGNALQTLLVAPDITPGDAPSYQLCKDIYAYHPLGAKLAEKPIALAQSKPRVISIPKAPEKVKEAFAEKWKELGCDASIFNLASLSRVYGVASLAILVDGRETNIPLDYKNLAQSKIAFNVFDPLNTAGSLVINQRPNDLDFMKTSGKITVSGKTYHPSRVVVMMNEQPLYIQYTTSGFGFVGRSVYQRSLFPLKSFINTMKTDDLIATKVGTVVYKAKQPGSVIDAVMGKMFGLKRQVIKEAQTYSVISIGSEEDIETLDMQNVDGAHEMSRKHILENIAAASDDMPAVLLNQETFAEGFGEGDNDAEMVKHYINRIREKLGPAYAFMEPIVMYMAWTEDFYKTIQNEFPEEYANINYETAFQEWKNSFTANWQPLFEEPPHEQVQVDEVKLKAAIAVAMVLLPAVDPENRARVIQWVCDTFNELKLLFGTTLELDFDALKNYVPEQQLEEPSAGKPFAAADSANIDRAVADFDAAVLKFVADRVKPRLVAGQSK